MEMVSYSNKAFNKCCERSGSLEEILDRQCVHLRKFLIFVFRVWGLVRTFRKVSSGNWEEIKDEISHSNVVQRDSSLFAKKLDRCLVDYAKEMEDEVMRWGVVGVGG